MTMRVVYFAKAVGFDSPIKIGYARNLELRMQTLQSQCPWEIEVLHYVPGDEHDEREIQARFTDAQVRGEWFEATDKLTSFIKNLKDGMPLEEALTPLPRFHSVPALAAFRAHETRRRNRLATLQSQGGSQ